MKLVKEFYFTFGCGQKHQGRYVKILATDSEEAREQMHTRFGDKWSMMYSKKMWEEANSPYKTLAEEWGWKEL